MQESPPEKATHHRHTLSIQQLPGIALRRDRFRGMDVHIDTVQWTERAAWWNITDVFNVILHR